MIVKRIYKKMFRLTCCYLFIGMFNLACAQDAGFSQFYATRDYLNPAFSAILNGHSFTTTYRNQWPGIPDSYKTNLVSYSHSLQKSGAGLSCYFLNDLAGVGSLRKQSFAAQYAKGVRMGKNVVAALGVRGSYNVNSIKWGKLKWGDMIDARNGFVYSTNQPNGLAKMSYFDVSSGLIVYSEKFHAGIAMEHINRPQIGILSISGNSHLLIRYKFHIGADFKLQDFPTKITVNLLPQLIYMKQGENKQLSIGAYLGFSKYKSKNKLIIGTWYRISDSFIILVGTQSKRYRIGYSFDLGVNKLISHSGGAHELSLSYNFEVKRNKNKRRLKSFACPYF